jgi:hypothetical protein
MATSSAFVFTSVADPIVAGIVGSVGPAETRPE